MSTRSRSPRRRKHLARLTILLIAFGVAFGVAAPAGALLTGIDVASYQHPKTQQYPSGAPIDWNAVKVAGHSFGYVKATEYRSSSSSYINPWFKRDWDAAGNAGLYRGAYHFAIPSYPVVADALEEARYFISVTGSMTGPLDLPAMLDLEYNPYGADACYGLSQGDFVTWARTWLDEVKRLTGKAPVVYTGASYWDTCSGRSTAIGGDYRLWIASYPNDPNSTTFRPTVPTGWSAWSFWQYTSTGSVPGIIGNVDVNRFCCDFGNLAALGGNGAGAGNPFGNIESMLRLPTSIQIGGWAIDPDSRDPIKVHVYVDGQWGGEYTANGSRPDVGAVYTGYGSIHGLQVSVPVPPGEHRVCVYAINVGGGSTNPEMSCQTVASLPTGNFESVISTGPGAIRASGWAVDPDTTSALEIDVFVDDVFVKRGATGQARPDVATAFPGATGQAGFSIDVFGVSGGSHKVCVRAVNAGAVQTRVSVGCRTVAVPGGNPIGNFDFARAGFATMNLVGWVLDPDTANPVAVHVYVDGQWGGAYTADANRPDVGAAYQGVGPNHGFHLSIRVPGGVHTACVYAINVGIGTTNPLVGCRTLTISSTPGGSIDWSARAFGHLGISGWAIDPDTNAPVKVRVTVDGTVLTTITADGSRPDVGAAFPGVGDLHGYSHVWPAPAGPARVCLTILNAGAGSTNTDLGCRTL
jgi:GH25 family lysozyme M1 (1,4-beta-N-acetylmuramidase)